MMQKTQEETDFENFIAQKIDQGAQEDDEDESIQQRLFDLFCAIPDRKFKHIKAMSQHVSAGTLCLAILKLGNYELEKDMQVEAQEEEQEANDKVMGAWIVVDQEAANTWIAQKYHEEKYLSLENYNSLPGRARVLFCKMCTPKCCFTCKTLRFFEMSLMDALCIPLMLTPREFMQVCETMSSNIVMHCALYFGELKRNPRDGYPFVDGYNIKAIYSRVLNLFKERNYVVDFEQCELIVDRKYFTREALLTLVLPMWFQSREGVIPWRGVIESNIVLKIFRELDVEYRTMKNFARLCFLPHECKDCQQSWFNPEDFDRASRMYAREPSLENLAMLPWPFRNDVLKSKLVNPDLMLLFTEGFPEYVQGSLVANQSGVLDPFICQFQDCRALKVCKDGSNLKVLGDFLCQFADRPYPMFALMSAIHREKFTSEEFFKLPYEVQLIAARYDHWSLSDRYSTAITLLKNTRSHLIAFHNLDSTTEEKRQKKGPLVKEITRLISTLSWHIGDDQTELMKRRIELRGRLECKKVILELEVLKDSVELASEVSNMCKNLQAVIDFFSRKDAEPIAHELIDAVRYLREQLDKLISFDALPEGLNQNLSSLIDNSQALSKTMRDELTRELEIIRNSIMSANDCSRSDYVQRAKDLKSQIRICETELPGEQAKEELVIELESLRSLDRSEENLRTKFEDMETKIKQYGQSHKVIIEEIKRKLDEINEGIYDHVLLSDKDKTDFVKKIDDLTKSLVSSQTDDKNQELVKEIERMNFLKDIIANLRNIDQSARREARETLRCKLSKLDQQGNQALNLLQEELKTENDLSAEAMQAKERLANLFEKRCNELSNEIESKFGCSDVISLSSLSFEALSAKLERIQNLLADDDSASELRNELETAKANLTCYCFDEAKVCLKSSVKKIDSYCDVRLKNEAQRLREETERLKAELEDIRERFKDDNLLIELEMFDDHDFETPSELDKLRNMIGESLSDAESDSQNKLRELNAKLERLFENESESDIESEKSEMKRLRDELVSELKKDLLREFDSRLQSVKSRIASETETFQDICVGEINKLFFGLYRLYIFAVKDQELKSELNAALEEIQEDPASKEDLFIEARNILLDALAHGDENIRDGLDLILERVFDSRGDLDLFRDEIAKLFNELKSASSKLIEPVEPHLVELGKVNLYHSDHELYVEIIKNLRASLESDMSSAPRFLNELIQVGITKLFAMLESVADDFIIKELNGAKSDVILKRFASKIRMDLHYFPATMQLQALQVNHWLNELDLEYLVMHFRDREDIVRESIKYKHPEVFTWYEFMQLPWEIQVVAAEYTDFSGVPIALIKNIDTPDKKIERIANFNNELRTVCFGQHAQLYAAYRELPDRRFEHVQAMLLYLPDEELIQAILELGKQELELGAQEGDQESELGEQELELGGQELDIHGREYFSLSNFLSLPRVLRIKLRDYLESKPELVRFCFELESFTQVDINLFLISHEDALTLPLRKLPLEKFKEIYSKLPSSIIFRCVTETNMIQGQNNDGETILVPAELKYIEESGIAGDNLYKENMIQEIHTLFRTRNYFVTFEMCTHYVLEQHRCRWWRLVLYMYLHNSRPVPWRSHIVLTRFTRTESRYWYESIMDTYKGDYRRYNMARFGFTEAEYNEILHWQPYSWRDLPDLQYIAYKKELNEWSEMPACLRSTTSELLPDEPDEKDQRPVNFPDDIRKKRPVNFPDDIRKISLEEFQKLPGYFQESLVDHLRVLITNLPTCERVASLSPDASQYAKTNQILAKHFGIFDLPTCELITESPDINQYEKISRTLCLFIDVPTVMSKLYFHLAETGSHALFFKLDHVVQLKLLDVAGGNLLPELETVCKRFKMALYCGWPEGWEELAYLHPDVLGRLMSRWSDGCHHSCKFDQGWLNEFLKASLPKSSKLAIPGTNQNVISKMHFHITYQAAMFTDCDLEFLLELGKNYPGVQRAYEERRMLQRNYTTFTWSEFQSECSELNLAFMIEHTDFHGVSLNIFLEFIQQIIREPKNLCAVHMYLNKYYPKGLTFDQLICLKPIMCSHELMEIIIEHADSNISFEVLHDAFSDIQQFHLDVIKVKHPKKFTWAELINWPFVIDIDNQEIIDCDSIRDVSWDKIFYECDLDKRRIILMKIKHKGKFTYQEFKRLPGLAQIVAIRHDHVEKFSAEDFLSLPIDLQKKIIDLELQDLEAHRERIHRDPKYFVEKFSYEQFKRLKPEFQGIILTQAQDLIGFKIVSSRDLTGKTFTPGTQNLLKDLVKRKILIEREILSVESLSIEPLSQTAREISSVELLHIEPPPQTVALPTTVESTMSVRPKTLKLSKSSVLSIQPAVVKRKPLEIIKTDVVERTPKIISLEVSDPASIDRSSREQRLVIDEHNSIDIGSRQQSISISSGLDEISIAPCQTPPDTSADTHVVVRTMIGTWCQTTPPELILEKNDDINVESDKARLEIDENHVIEFEVLEPEVEEVEDEIVGEVAREIAEEGVGERAGEVARDEEPEENIQDEQKKKFNKFEIALFCFLGMTTVAAIVITSLIKTGACPTAMAIIKACVGPWGSLGVGVVCAISLLIISACKYNFAAFVMNFVSRRNSGYEELNQQEHIPERTQPR